MFTSVCLLLASLVLPSDEGLVFTRNVTLDQRGVETTVVTVTNPTAKPLRVGSVTVWEMSGDASASFRRAFLDRDDAHDGIPSFVRLLEPDETFLTFASDFYWTDGDRATAFAKMPTTLDFSDFGWFDGGADADRKLVIGFTGLWTHYNDLSVSTDAARTAVTQIVARATFDCVLPPGKSRKTAPFVAFTAATPDEATGRYTSYVAIQASQEGILDLKRTFDAPPPSVGCTWHYWGAAIDEEKVLTDVAEVKRRGIPLDYFLIDDAWQHPYYGDWDCDLSRFPHGAKHLADSIRAAGMKPGIWSSPFSCNPTSRVARAHGDMFFRNAKGELCKWFGDHFVDPTHPEGLKFIRDLYTRLAKEYGFEYFKLDRVNFCYRPFRAKRPVCHDPTVTLVEAYRRAIAEVRAAVGEKAFVCICGGHFGASLGLCDTQRLSGDTYGSWYEGDKDDPTLMLEEGRLKQIFGRLRWRPLFYSNADGLEIRKRAKPLDLPRNWGLSKGLLTDDEAMATAVATYVAGGIVMFGDSAADLTEDRLAIYRRVIPSLGAQSRAVDATRPWIPSQYVTAVTPRCPTLGKWNTVSVFNFETKPAWPSVALTDETLREIPAKEYLAYETVTGTYLGRFPRGARIPLGQVPPHAARVVRIAPVPATPAPVLLGTDLHLSGGGVEVAAWTPRPDGTAEVVVRTPWPNRDVKVTYLPAGAATPQTLTVRPVDPAEVAAVESGAAAAVELPPDVRTANLAGYSTNRLSYALNNGLALTAKGRLWASWIAGEDGGGAFTVASFSDDRGETWSDVRFVIDGHATNATSRTNIIGTFWLDPNGKFRQYTDQSCGHFDGRAGIWESVADDPDAPVTHWSPMRRIGHGHVLNKPIVLANGHWAMAGYLNWVKWGSPAARAAFADLDPERGVTCYVSADGGATWEKRGTARFPGIDWQEAQFVQLKGGTLRAFARVQEGRVGKLMAADSWDEGRHWSAPYALPSMDNTNARFQVMRLKSGRLLYVTHGRPAAGGKDGQGRDKLAAYLSDDDGASWKGGLLLYAGNATYPDACQADDGTIFVTHDHDRGGAAEIWLHRFTEEDVLAGRIVSDKGKLNLLVSRAMGKRQK